MRRVYVYALVEQRARSFRIASRTVSFVECHQSSIGSIYAAVQQREDSPELSESSLKVQHEIVAALAQRFDAILPVRFGAFIEESEASLLDVLDNLLNRGVVLNADLILALANVDLVYVRLSALLCAADRLLPRDPK